MLRNGSLHGIPLLTDGREYFNVPGNVQCTFPDVLTYNRVRTNKTSPLMYVHVCLYRFTFYGIYMKQHKLLYWACSVYETCMFVGTPFLQNV